MNKFLAKAFSPDMQALSLFRILLGLILFADLFLSVLPCAPNILLESGFFPRSLYLQMEHRAGFVSLLTFTTNPRLIGLFFTVYGCFLVTLILGYRTRLSQWVVFICHCSFVYRASIIITGSDRLVHLFLLWSLFLPMNRYWSVDAALSRAPRDIPVPPVLLAGIKLQIIWLYLFGAIFKLYGPLWINGDAVGDLLRDIIWPTSLGHWFGAHFPFLLSPLTYGIIVFQLGFAVLIFSTVLQPYLRILALAGAAVMHASFLLFLNIGIFPFVCVAYLVLLVPDAWWNRLWAGRRARLEKIVIYFEDGCSFCEKTALLFREFCLSPFSLVRPASSDAEIDALLRLNKSWIVKDTLTGKIYMKWEAAAFLLRQSLVLWPFGIVTDLPYIKNLLARFYDWIGAHRPVFSALTSRVLPFRDNVYAPGILAKTICGMLIVLSLAENIMWIPSVRSSVKTPPAFWDVVTVSQTYQHWNLFAPELRPSFYSYDLEGTTSSGKIVDLRPLFEMGRFSSADSTHWTFSNFRWLLFVWRFYNPANRPVVLRTVQILAERYNAKDADPGDQLVTARMTLKRELIDDFDKGIPPWIVAQVTWPETPFPGSSPPGMVPFQPSEFPNQSTPLQSPMLPDQ